MLLISNNDLFDKNSSHMKKLQQDYGLSHQELECLSSIKGHTLQPLRFDEANEYMQQYLLPPIIKEDSFMIYEYCHRNIQQIFLFINHWQSKLQDFKAFKNRI